jgi:hypothetical protein
MEGNSLMERIKNAVLQEIRMGTSPDMVISILYNLADLVADARKQNANPYVAEIAQAIHDADFRP